MAIERDKIYNFQSVVSYIGNLINKDGNANDDDSEKSQF